MGRLLNLGQLALVLRLPRDWLRAEAEAGHIPCLRVGRRLRFNVSAVEDALSERARTPVAPADRQAVCTKEG
jgi:excisionase family DNA binding protein